MCPQRNVNPVHFRSNIVPGNISFQDFSDLITFPLRIDTIMYVSYTIVSVRVEFFERDTTSYDISV